MKGFVSGLCTCVCACMVMATGCSPKSDYTMTDGGASTPAEKGKVQKFDFEATQSGALPSEFVHVLGEWRVAQGPDGRFLEQVGDYHTDDFPRIVLKDVAFTNVHVKARCNMREGDTDQACGLLWHFQNSDNYYITRANALEGNVRLYKVVSGERKQFDTKSIGVSANAWHTLEAIMEGTHIRVLYDGQTLMDNNDSQFKSGKVGLWTKADSVTSFDDFEATEL